MNDDNQEVDVNPKSSRQTAQQRWWTWAKEWINQKALSEQLQSGSQWWLVKRFTIVQWDNVEAKSLMVYRKDLQVIRFIRYKLHPKSNYLTHLNLFMDETHNEYRFSHKVHERCDSGYIRFFFHWDYCSALWDCASHYSLWLYLKLMNCGFFFFTDPVAMYCGIALCLKDSYSAERYPRRQHNYTLPTVWNSLRFRTKSMTP